MPSRQPTDTPRMAPAAARDSSTWALTRKEANASPTPSLHRASMIWETAVGVMREWPWKYPRRADMGQMKNTAGARARMLQ